MGALQSKARVHDQQSEATDHAADQEHADYFFEVHSSPADTELRRCVVIWSQMARAVLRRAHYSHANAR
jgi:hypothetical protein